MLELTKHVSLCGLVSKTRLMYAGLVQPGEIIMQQTGLRMTLGQQRTLAREVSVGALGLGQQD
mgnify:CR=1 FL=1